MPSSKQSKAKSKGDADDRKRGRKLISAHAWAQAPKLAIGSIALIGSSHCNQAVPRLLGRLMDQSKSDKGASFSGRKLSLVDSIFIISVTGGICSLVRTTMLNRAENSIAAQLRKDAFATLITRKDLEWFQTQTDASIAIGADNKNNTKTEGKETSPQTEKSNDKDSAPSSSGLSPGAIGFILNQDIDTVAKTVTGTLANLLRSSSSCIFGTYHMLMLNPSLVGLSLCVAPVVGTLALATRKYLKRVLANQEEAAMKAAAFLEERLNHLALVKMCNREEHETQEFAKMQDTIVDLGKKSSLANGMSMGTMFSFSSMALCGILYSGGKSVESGKMRHGDLVSFGTYSFMLALGTAGVVKAIGDYVKGVDCAARLSRLMLNESNQASQSSSDQKVAPSLARDEITSVSLVDIGFSYKTNETVDVLQNMSLEIRRGEILALVGKNGSGKSTVASLLAGLYYPSSGSIKLNVGGKTVDFLGELGKVERSSLVKVVQQAPALFNTSIRENIMYGNSTASDKALSEVTAAANCGSFISQLADGLDFVVGRNGSRLSGGQRQRVELARALLADPAILILDEPSSALDVEGETAVADAIRECRTKNRALLIITHNKKTLELADRVAIIDGGSITESGNPSELLNNKKSALHDLMPDDSA